MTAGYPFHLVKVSGTWKWDMFSNLSREVCAQRLAALKRDALLLDALTREVHDGKITNVANVLETFRSAAR
jgi:hypothetical protein